MLGPEHIAFWGFGLLPKLYLGQKVPWDGWVEWGRGSQEGLEAASCPSFVRQTALWILRMTHPVSVSGKQQKNYSWEILVPGSIGLALSPQSLVPALGVLIQLGFGTEPARRARSVMPEGMSSPSSISSSCCFLLCICDA